MQAYATRVSPQYAAELQPSSDQSARPRLESTSESRSRYNPTLNYKYYMVPGILVALMTIIGSLLSAQNIAREKELGTLEQLNVTPITRGEFITAKLLPFWVLGLIELALGLVIAVVVFDMPMRGACRCSSSSRPCTSRWRSASASGSPRSSTRSSRRCSSPFSS